MLHFNARSVCNKFDEITAEIIYRQPTVVCISETWIGCNTPTGPYTVDGYTGFFNCRRVKAGGGTMVLIKRSLPARLLTPDVSVNDAFNVCAVVIGSGSRQILITAVYRAPWASSSDNESFSAALDTLLLKYTHTVVVGDFNIPNLLTPCGRAIAGHLELEHGLLQLATSPTRDTALLDLVFVSNHFANGSVTNIPPIGESDHNAQLITLPAHPPEARRRMHRVIDYQHLLLELSGVNWSRFFSSCVHVDDYANKFTDFLLAAVAASSSYRPAMKRRRLPKHIVRMLLLKRRKWKESRRSGNFDAYKVVKRNVRAAIRQHRRNLEYRLTFSRNRKAFFSYVYDKLGRANTDICLDIDGTAASDSSAAKAFLSEFSSNFSRAADVYPVAPLATSPDDLESTLLLNCTEADIAAALQACPNSNSSPDGISYLLLKTISGLIIQPMNIIYQQSLFAGIFPSAWKRAVVIPLYKGRGDRKATSSYRPISLCPCLGKLLEKVVNKQLSAYLSDNDLLHPAQHGFLAGRSTVTNMLTADLHIADAISAGHPYDLLTFDFKKAFDRASHFAVISSLAKLGITGRTLNWFASFLSGRTQVVRVGASNSQVGAVPSGVVQGSCLGPTLFTALLDSLLRRIRLPVGAFADDVKFMADVVTYSRAEVQVAIDTLCDWSDENDMQLSIEKCAVLHCGRHQPNFEYRIRGALIPCVDSVVDLGLLRSSSGGYTGHCQAVAAKASRLAGAIRRSFQLKSPQLLWPAFQAYVAPVLMYGSPAWSPCLRRDSDIVERVQRKFLKSIPELHDLPYSERLSHVNALSLQNRRLYADLVLAYRALHGMLGCPGEEFGLVLSTSVTRGNGVALQQRRLVTRASSALFAFRVPSAWNQLPVALTSSKSLSIFKRGVANYLSKRSD